MAVPTSGTNLLLLLVLFLYCASLRMKCPTRIHSPGLASGTTYLLSERVWDHQSLNSTQVPNYRAGRGSVQHE